MDKEKRIHRIKTFCLFCVVSILVVLVFNTSYMLVSDSLIEEIKVDRVSSNYISFNYVDNNEHILEIVNPKKVSDFLGKKMFSDNYFEFDVNFSDEDLVREKVYYDVVLMDLGNLIDEEFIKIYLTNQDDQSLIGYDKVVPVLSTFKTDIDGKIIYTGCFDKDNLTDDFRLRIWVSNKYKKDINNILDYHIKVKIRN